MAGDSEWSTGSPRTPNNRACTRLATLIPGTHGRRAGHPPVPFILRPAAAGPLIRSQRRLRRCETRDRHPIRRAGDVIQPDAMAEAYRGGLSAMLAADAELQVRSHPVRLVDGDLHERADAVLVERLEWIAWVDTEPVDVWNEEAARVVARHAERGLGQVVGAEREEIGDARDLVRGERAARHLDHGADEI